MVINLLDSISLYCLVISIVHSCASSSLFNQPIVDTPFGLVHGKYLKVNESQVACFFGLPYTLPPVGPLRFTRTYPISHYHHYGYHKKRIIKADQFKSACMQSPSGYTNHAGNVTLSEDCLYLNIFKPANEKKTTELYPVFVYVHGSAFAFGGPGGVHNQAHYLSSIGDIMVVTMACRLGILGRAYDGSKSDDYQYPHHLPGNQDFHDVIQSLQWVQDHIHYFGGDPERVTLGGLSAGAVVSTALFVSPVVPDGLFNKVVAMSGLPMTPSTTMTPKRSKNITWTISSTVNCSSLIDFEKEDRPFNWNEIHCLKRVDSLDLIQAQSPIDFFPMFGDEILPRRPQELVISPNFKRSRYSLLIGTEQNEDVVSHLVPKTVNEAINYLINIHPGMAEVENRTKLSELINSYFNEIPDDQVQNQTKVQSAFHAIISDYTFICPSLLMGKRFSLNNQVHFYRNELILDANKDDRPFGTLHADDNALFIGSPFLTPELYSDSDRKASLQMIKLLATFVKDGYVPWPAVRVQGDKVTPYVWKITEDLDFENFEVDPYNERCHEWAQIFSFEDL